MKNLQPLPAGQPWPRDYLLTLLTTALSAKAYRFAEQTALAWLTHYENDLEIQLLRAQALIGDGRAAQALSLLKRICQADPEYRQAQELRARTLSNANAKGISEALGCALALGCEFPATQKLAHPVPAWAQPLRAARHAMRRGDLAGAQEHLTSALGSPQPPALVAVTHLKSMWLQSDTPPQAIRNLGEHYHKQWPECVTIQLLLADSMMNSGAAEKAVALLHRAAASDPAGQVAARLWGEDNPYATLWPETPQAVVDVSVPAEVAAALGWNLLPLGEPRPHTPREAAPRAEARTPTESAAPPDPPRAAVEETPSPTPKAPSPSDEDLQSKLEAARAEALRLLNRSDADPETPRQLRDELKQAASRLHLDAIAHADGHHPIYVVLSTRAGLERQFGAQTAQVIDGELEKLVLTVRQRRGWGALLMYPDDPAAMASLGLKPCSSTDPWALKLALTDLDNALRKKGAMIGALLIVGGPEVVPFHHLPNPTDDNDADVPSDNPYATAGENYFIPEWPVGRIPGGAGRDPALLLSCIRGIIKAHEMANLRPGGLRTWLAVLGSWFIRLLPGKKAAESLGYSAEIWQRAALAVYRVIGEPRQLVTSPPEGIHSSIPEPAARLGYFNLHGVVDAADWYGQRDPSNYPKPGVKPIEEGPDFPVALRPEDVVNSGRAPQVVFSEACYGAHIYGRSVEDSLALKFLSAGSRAVIGSTVTAYGSVAAPLIAADLLGKAFWRYLNDGYPVGEALRRAKITLAREMHKRQGYLDGEDQKTLISFVLYGDPLARPDEFPIGRQPKDVLRFAEKPPQVKTVCDRCETPGVSEPISEEIMAEVRQTVAKYLPGMENAHLALSREHIECEDGHECPTQQLGAKTRPKDLPRRKVVMLHQERHDAYRVHPTFARLTLDEHGKVVKLAVSR